MENGKQPKLILSDSDGVIIDSFDLLYANMAELFRQRVGKELSTDQYRAFFDGNALANVQKAIGAKPGENFSKADKALVFKGYGDLEIFAGMVDAYTALAKQHTLAVITSTSVEYASAVIDRHGLTDEVAAIIGPDVAVAKDVRIKMAMKEFGFASEQTWYITDTIGDIAEAKASGVHTLAVTWGYQDEAKLKDADPDALVHTPQELLHFFS